MPTLTIELVVAVVTIGQIRLVIAACATLAGLLVLAASARKLRGTTLVMPWCWSLATVASWGALECYLALRPELAKAAITSALELAVITLSLCPVIALMGAKRPQDKAWSFVVLAFWVMLILPAAETLLLHPGQRPSLGGARGWFLWLPILLGLVTYLPTRYGLAAVCLAAGQMIALSPYLALLGRSLVPESRLTGYVIAIGGTAVAWCFRHRAGVAEHDLDRQWKDFRDSFGLFWALRVQERMNAMAQQHHWPATLYWTGFYPSAAGGPSPKPPADASSSQAAFRGLLRRFVGADWLRARAQKSRPIAETTGG